MMLPKVEESEGEKYLYGLASPSIKSRRADLRGCGVYATTKRILLVRAPLRIQVLFLFPWSMAIVFLLSCLIIMLNLLFTKNAGSASLSAPAYFYLFWPGFAFLFVGLGSSWYKDFSQVPIKELEQRKILEFKREQVSKLEMSRSVFWTSRIVVYLRGGERHSILFAEPGSFDRAKHAFEVFSPSHSS
jgi:hypothetical protein